MKANPHIENLESDYLFTRIARRKQELIAKEPKAKVISLGLGDTTQPLPSLVVEAMREACQRLGEPKSYSGYGTSEGHEELRAALSERVYKGRVPATDIFISDGAKCDIGRLQVMFGNNVSIAVQDPSYPAYVASSRIMGQPKLCFWPCLPDNDFFPDLNSVEPADIIFFCAPNNPTGAVATRAQLTELVAYALKHGSLIIYDVAYAAFLRDPSLPSSIYEIEGADRCAIETGSFSKMIGFTGVRCGWTVVPSRLKYENGSSVQSAWSAVINTYFNGASNIVQAGALAALSDAGLQEVRRLTDYYLENARLIREGLEAQGKRCFGGTHCPYIWADFDGQDSWQAFDELLERCHVVTTPGAGFGPAGEGFVRISGFGLRDEVREAVERIARGAARCV